MVLEKTLERPLDCKEIQPVHPKGDQSWKKNGTLPLAVTWMDLEGIMLSEVMSDRERQILYDVTHTWTLKNSRN